MDVLSMWRMLFVPRKEKASKQPFFFDTNGICIHVHMYTYICTVPAASLQEHKDCVGQLYSKCLVLL